MNLNLEDLYNTWAEHITLARKAFQSRDIDTAYEILIDRIFLSFNLFTTGDKEPIYIYNEEQGIWDEKGCELLRQIIDKMLPMTKILQKKEIIDRIRIRSRRPTDDVEPKKHILVLRNTAFDLQTFTPISFNEFHYKRNRLDILYNKEATSPKFDAFLDYFFPNPADRETIFEVLAWTFMDWGYPIRKFVVFYGQGANGKSTLINIFKTFIGMENIASIPIHHLNQQYNISDLYGKTANIVDELSNKAVYDLATLKNVTGDSFIGTARKYKNRLNFKNIAKMIYACNDPPALYEDTNALWDRIYPIHCQVELPEDERIVGYVDQLTTDAELSGILNQVLQAYYTLMKQGHFTHDRTGKEKREDYLLDTNILPLFVNDCLLEEANTYIDKNDLWTEICRYARARKVKAPSMVLVSRRLPEYIYTFAGKKQINNKRRHVWYNIRLKDEYDDIITDYEQLGVGNE